MKSARTGKIRYFSLCLFVFTLLLPFLACSGSKNDIQGKWEANIVSKRSGQGSKVIYEFLPDGTFKAMPPGDTTVVDRDKYQVLDEGRMIKIRSQLFGGGAEAVCKFVGSAIQCDTDEAKVNLTKL